MTEAGQHFTYAEKSVNLYFSCWIIVTLRLMEMVWRLVQTAAARQLTVLNPGDLISPVLATLPWLPFNSRDEKSFSLLTKPLMTTLLIVPFNTSRSLFSPKAGLFEVPRSCKWEMELETYSA